MMKSALGDAASLADYDVVKKRLLGSRYAMDFTNGVKFDLDVATVGRHDGWGPVRSDEGGHDVSADDRKWPADKLALEDVSVIPTVPGCGCTSRPATNNSSLCCNRICLRLCRSRGRSYKRQATS